MKEYHIVNASIGLWGFAVLLLIFHILNLLPSMNRKKKNWIKCLLVLAGLLMLHQGIASLLCAYDRMVVRPLHLMIHGAAFLFSYFFLLAGNHYIAMLIPSGKTEKKDWFFYVVEALGYVGCMMTLTGGFTKWFFYIDQDNTFRQGPLFFLLQTVGGIGIVILAEKVRINHAKIKDEDYYGVLHCLRLLIISMVARAVFPYLAFDVYACGIAGVGIGISYILSDIRQQNQEEICLLKEQAKISYMEAKLRVQNAEIQKKDREIREKKMQLLVTQIHPHFIFNSLLVIRSLCMEDADRAVDAITHFSKYLRIVLDTMNKDQVIPFEKEMELTENYLYMEQLRFGYRIVFKKDIQIQGFLIPALTLQPMVENAVRHGIRGSSKSGTIWVSTEDAGECIILKIRDNGIGYDPSKKQNDGRAHVGIDNVRERLELLCEGTLEIVGVVHEGTTVTIKIPKKKGQMNGISDRR